MLILMQDCMCVWVCVWEGVCVNMNVLLAYLFFCMCSFYVFVFCLYALYLCAHSCLCHVAMCQCRVSYN